MSIVVDSPVTSTKGRKPVSAAVVWDFANDLAGGMVCAERFGNGPTVTIAGTEGAIWTGSRGLVRLNGTDNQAVVTPGHALQAYIENNIVPGMLTLGRALVVTWRFGWPSAAPSSNEVMVALGRNHSSSAQIRLGTANTKPVNCTLIGVGASASTSASFGSASLYTTGRMYSVTFHIEPKAGGVDVYNFLDGNANGTVQEFLWTANGGAVPAASVFALPDGLTIGAQRGGSNPAAPSWTQRIGASNSAGTALGFVGLLAPAVGSLSATAALALELYQYPHYAGEIMAAF